MMFMISIKNITRVIFFSRPLQLVPLDRKTHNVMCTGLCHVHFCHCCKFCVIAEFEGKKAF